MRKFVLLIMLVLLSSAVAFGQIFPGRSGYGVGYGVYNISEDLGGGITGNSLVQSVGLSISQTIGSEIVFVSDLYAGILTGFSASITDGSSTITSGAITLDDTHIVSTFLFAPGYVIPIDGSQSLLVAAGLSVFAVLPVGDDDFSSNLIAYNLGVGAKAEYLFRLSDTVSLGAGIRGQFDFFNLLAASDFITGGFGVTPSASLVITF